MKLTSINYAQFEGQPQEWKLSGLTLRDTNLLVGKNASGKSRALSVIFGLAQLLARATKLMFSSGNYDVVFDDDGNTLQYTLHYENNKVILERFILDGKKFLERGTGGVGKIMALKNDTEMDFQTPEDELATVNRQDSIQHPFFAPLLQWAGSLYYYPFGTTLGKDVLAFIVKDPVIPFDPKDPGRVVAKFRQGLKDFGDPFKRSIIADMSSIGYELEDVDTQPLASITLTGPFGGPAVGMCVKEKSLRGMTDQNEMSQGMFRALSVIAQITFAQMSTTPSAVLIDDIGEGLDFERSCQLIKLLMNKAAGSHVQLIMATNDRFVMNAVPLESWSVLKRCGGGSRIFNYDNSKAKFDEFKFTGMNNFDFFATDFLDEGEHR